jgi:hypothetical protein
MAAPPRDGLQKLLRYPVPTEYENHKRAVIEILAGCALILVLVLGDGLVANRAHWDLIHMPSLQSFWESNGIIPLMEYLAFIIVTAAGAFTSVVLGIAGAVRITRAVYYDIRSPQNTV